MAVRAIRGATQVDADDREQVLEATRELVSAVLERNALEHDDIISILFTAMWRGVEQVRHAAKAAHHKVEIFSAFFTVGSYMPTDAIVDQGVRHYIAPAGFFRAE